MGSSSATLLFTSSLIPNYHPLELNSPDPSRCPIRFVCPASVNRTCSGQCLHFSDLWIVLSSYFLNPRSKHCIQEATHLQGLTAFLISLSDRSCVWRTRNPGIKSNPCTVFRQCLSRNNLCIWLLRGSLYLNLYLFHSGQRNLIDIWFWNIIYQLFSVYFARHDDWRSARG
jgi:hypothetical protein